MLSLVVIVVWESSFMSCVLNLVSFSNQVLDLLSCILSLFWLSATRFQVLKVVVESGLGYKDFLNSKVILDIPERDTGEGTELLDGNELMGLFVIMFPDFGQKLLPITFTFAGDELDIFWVYDTSFF